MTTDAFEALRQHILAEVAAQTIYVDAVFRPVSPRR